jgi:PD-(D/E)XK nuclease superfamily
MTTETKTIPPLSQSRYEAMACSLFYQASQVKGIRVESEPSRRGNEFHRFVAQYMETLRIDRVPTNYEKLALLTREATPEVSELLETFGEARFYDPEKIYDTELYIGLDEDFRIVEVRGQSDRDQERKEGTVYEGTIDLLIMESETEAVIEDFKTYFQIVDADSFQSKLYPLLVMLMNPRIETVRFILSFVRYGDAQREVTWTKADIPHLMELVRRARGRQIDLHTKPASRLKATPGRHCAFCPLLLTECPMREVNPFTTIDKEERVALALWMTYGKKENDRILKDWLAESGPITYADENGTKYVAQFVKAERKSYPLLTTEEILSAWVKANPKDAAMVAKLSVSGLSSPLKAQKRDKLAAELVQIAEVKTLTKMSIGLGDDEEDEQ